MSFITNILNWFLGLSKGNKVVLIAAIISALATIMAPLVADDKPTIKAEKGGIAVGGDIIGSTINSHNGLKSEGVETLLKQQEDAIKTKDIVINYKDKEIQDISQKYNVSVDAVKSFFKILQEQNVPPEQHGVKLQEIAAKYLELKNQLANLPADTSTAVRALYKQAEEAFEAGRYDEAKEILKQADDIDIADIEKRQLQSAANLSRIADISLVQLRYLEAADYFAQAQKRVPASNNYMRWSYLIDQANALQQHGEYKADNQALVDAIAVYKQALALAPQADFPYDWAETQNNLGNALQTIGKRQSDNKMLEEAVTAYREALKEYTQEKVPLDWAMTQNNLGGALQTIGERQSDNKMLEEAVTAYREALKERTQEEVPLQWAGTQNNLGNALQSIGKRQSDNKMFNKMLEEAVTAYLEALKEYTQEKVPLDWAMTQNNLGSALRTIGERQSDNKMLEEAVTAYREALKERTQEKVPLQWAGTQNNLGSVLEIIGKRKHEPALLKEALQATNNTYDVYVKESGQVQYEEYFQIRIRRLEEAIAEFKK
ncbi:MAG: tetratricopeptide repeat protein [Rickettsiales bacterium]|nr:tetratricopeptide repeat protein [Rickettsiales bacterium]MDG4547507.1 tetratricopeptide repeat protein [Rickettsiales bacterium]